MTFATGPLALLALASMFFPALAHDSWISNGRMTDPLSGEWCCNKHDCQAEKVSEVAGGYLTQGGDVVAYSRVIWDSRTQGQWVRCRNLSTNATRCLIGPPPGS